MKIENDIGLTERFNPSLESSGCKHGDLTITINNADCLRIDNEFENLLYLLSNDLRLNPKQQQAINVLKDIVFCVLEREGFSND